jgi:hypothetical protein
VGKKTAGCLSHFYIKVIFLPRQARDKHRESTRKEPVFSQIREVLPEIKKEVARPIHCVQRPGEIYYIPEGCKPRQAKPWQQTVLFPISARTAC